jgi:HEAT repeat protein
LSYKKDGIEGDHYKVREDAARALGEIGDAQAAQPLIDALGYGNYEPQEGS